MSLDAWLSLLTVLDPILHLEPPDPPLLVLSEADAVPPNCWCLRRCLAACGSFAARRPGLLSATLAPACGSFAARRCLAACGFFAARRPGLLSATLAPAARSAYTAGRLALLGPWCRRPWRALQLPLARCSRRWCLQRLLLHLLLAGCILSFLIRRGVDLTLPRLVDVAAVSFTWVRPCPCSLDRQAPAQSSSRHVGTHHSDARLRRWGLAVLLVAVHLTNGLADRLETRER